MLQMILNLEELWSWVWCVPMSFARMICSGRLGGLVWTFIMSPLERVLQIGSGDLFVTQKCIIALCRMPLSGEELVIIMPRSGCGMPDVVVCVGRAGADELVVGLWYLIFLMVMSLPMSKHLLILESALGNRW
jgi:hypothetical protein